LGIWRECGECGGRAYVVDSILLGVRWVFDLFVLEAIVIESGILVAPVSYGFSSETLTRQGGGKWKEKEREVDIRKPSH
jgi:hypothetical protein